MFDNKHILSQHLQQAFKKGKLIITFLTGEIICQTWPFQPLFSQLTHSAYWTLTISDRLLSFLRSTLGQQEFQCLHRIDRRYGIFWAGLDICFGQLQILFLVSEGFEDFETHNICQSYQHKFKPEYFRPLSA